MAIVGLPYTDRRASIAACPIPKLISVFPRSFENDRHLTSGASAPRSAWVSERRKMRRPDLDDEALANANIDELRRAALLSARASQPRKNERSFIELGQKQFIFTF